MNRRRGNLGETAASESPSRLSISPQVRLPWLRLLDAFPKQEEPAKKAVRSRGRRIEMDITWVTERIGVGGGIWNADNMAAIARAGITHIIDMQIEFDDTPLAVPHGIVVCWNPVDDDFEPKGVEVFEQGVEFALAAFEEDQSKIFIHCAAGVHRAPMMTLALLGVMGWTTEDAMDLIEGKRPVADFAEVYVRSVEEYLKGRL
jgi:protein tyrosine phosphatase (PTP) superfamily phosphohydrolase (DUF442 family)